MVGQHDPAGPHANSRRAAGEITNYDGRCCAPNAGHVVMFGNPVALVTKRFGMLREIDALVQSLARFLTQDDRNEIENRDGNHACSLACRKEAQRTPSTCAFLWLRQYSFGHHPGM